MWEDNSLEPKDWESFKECGKQILVDLFNYIEDIDNEKVWKPMSKGTIEKLEEPIPVECQSIEESYQEFLETILKTNSPMNIHPGFFGWVMGCGNPVGVLAEMLAAGMNSNVIGGTQVPCKVENQVIDWLKSLFGFGHYSSGVLTSGCSEANLIALTVARNQVENSKVKQQGLCGIKEKMIFYTSVERHHSVDKAIEIIGVGSNNLHLVPVNEEFQMDINALEEMIVNDQEAGYYPIGVIANLGTVNSGAVDDLSKIYEITTRENLWLHVDGAFGALAALTEKYKKLGNILNKVDSLAFDLHKWLYMPYGVGCVLVQNQKSHYETFAASSEYINHREVWYSDYGFELSRGFDALKVWLCMKTYGLNKYKALIEADLKKATYLGELILRYKELELLSPVSLNIVCFRYRGKKTDDEQINSINKRILMSLQFEGKVFPSETSLNGKYAIRVSIANYKCQKNNLEYLVKRVLEIGRKIG